MKRYFVQPETGCASLDFHTQEEAMQYARAFGPQTTITDRGPQFSKEQIVAERSAKSPNLLCFIEQFPLAMVAIAEVHDYSRGPLVKGDYRPSLLRHLLKIGEHPDHDAAVAWNAIAHLEMTLRQTVEETNE